MLALMARLSDTFLTRRRVRRESDKRDSYPTFDENSLSTLPANDEESKLPPGAAGRKPRRSGSGKDRGKSVIDMFFDPHGSRRSSDYPPDLDINNNSQMLRYLIKEMGRLRRHQSKDSHNLVS